MEFVLGTPSGGKTSAQSHASALQSLQHSAAFDANAELRGDPVEIAQRWLETAGYRDLVTYLAGKLTTSGLIWRALIRLHEGYMPGQSDPRSCVPASA